MQTQTRIDYLAYTVPSGEDWIRWDMRDMGFTFHRPGYPHSQYQRSFDCKNGALVRENDDPDNHQGTFVQMKGDTLAMLPYEVQSQLAIWVSENAQSVARSDLTLDMHFEDAFEWLSPLHWRMLWYSKECKCRVTKETIRENTRYRNYAGMTWTLGSEKADRFLRVYDKAAELKMPDHFWTRFEMQCRNRLAEASLQRVAEFGLAPTIKRVLNQYCEFHHPVWKAAMSEGGEQAVFEHLTTRKQTDVAVYLAQMEKRLAREVRKSAAHRTVVLHCLANMEWRLWELSKNMRWEGNDNDIFRDFAPRDDGSDFPGIG